jgi:cysteine desulfurase
MKKIYLDYAASTPIDPRVLRVIGQYMSKEFANTMSLHQFGQESGSAAEESRKIMAKMINAKPEEIVFTSSATESNNFALKGIAFANRDKGNHIIISSIEHDCLMESAKWLEGQGFEVTRLKVDTRGLVSLYELRKAIRKGTILVSVMHANNETGIIQPIKEIGKICRNKGIYFHTDAAQTFGKIPIDVEKMNIDLLTTSSHKIYGPKGAAFLYIREGIDIEPLLHGGGQEGGLRSSTVNVPAIVGFAKAAEIAVKSMKKENRRLTKMSQKIIKSVLKIKGSYLNGDSGRKLPNITNFRFDFVEGEAIMLDLDQKGIAVSTGSACSSATLEPSHVLLAMGLDPAIAHGSLRVSIGRFTTDKEINYFLKVLPQTIKKLRDISPFKSH